MFRTTCLGRMSFCVSTWISVTSPCGDTTTRAERIPVRLVIRFSARFTPQGSGACGGIKGKGSCDESSLGVRDGLIGVTSTVSCHHLVAAAGLGAIHRAVRGDPHVFPLPIRRIVRRHADAHGHEPLRIAQPPPHLLHAGAYLVGHAPPAV